MSPMKGRRARRGAARARFFPAHLNLHDLPVRPGMLLAMADQHRGPWRATHLRSSSSSCLVGGRGGGEWAAGRRAGMSARENTQQTSTPEKTSPPPLARRALVLTSGVHAPRVSSSPYESSAIWRIMRRFCCRTAALYRAEWRIANHNSACDELKGRCNTTCQARRSSST